MATGVGPAAEHHVSGLYVTMLIDNLSARLSEEAIRGVLSRAGETRDLEEVSAASSWCSYDEFRRLLQEATRTLEALPGADASASRAQVKLESELAGTIQALGSPASSSPPPPARIRWCPSDGTRPPRSGRTSGRSASGSSTGSSPIPSSAIRGRTVRDHPALLRPQAGEGHRGGVPVPGRQRLPLPDCAGRGSTRIGSRAEYFEVRTQLLEARLEQLQDMITDLASNERYEDVLQGIVGSSMRTAVVPVARSWPSSPRAGRVPEDLLRGPHRSGGGGDRQ